MNRRLPRTGAFTLLELLCVVAVIGLLAALSLPSLSRAKQSARLATCTSNLHQLGLAGQMYWDDHDGQAFRFRGSSSGNGDLFWFGWLERGAEGSRRFDVTQGTLYPYLSGRGVELCPALKSVIGRFKSKAIGAAYGYGYNLNLSARPPLPPLKVSTIAQPGQIIFLADSAQVNTFQAPASPENPMLEEFYYVNEDEPTAHFRHALKANAVFCDGHVALERMVPGSLDTRLPAENVGRMNNHVLKLEED